MGKQADSIVMSQHAGVTVGEFSQPKLLDEMSICRISDELGQLVDRTDKPMLVLDFSNVLYMSSVALGMLVTLRKRIGQRDGQLRLCSIHPDIHKVFVITKLTEVFEIHPERAAALASLT